MARVVVLAMAGIGALALAGAAPSAPSFSTSLVISEVYAGAGCGTPNCSTYQNDYIEIHNLGSTNVSTSGMSVQYADTGSGVWQMTPLSAVQLLPGEYFLVKEAFSANGMSALPGSDTTGTIDMNPAGGKALLLSTTGMVSGVCVAGGAIIDFVGWGNADCSETSPAAAQTTTTSDQRLANGCTDTDVNSADFTVAAPTPQYTGSPDHNCASAVGLVSFTGSRGPHGVTLRWRIGSSAGVLGFEVYRGGTRLTHAPILVTRWVDRHAPHHAVRYRLAEISLAGKQSWLGTTTVR
jgi:predicted extracellular nuclease